jgi:co-chaperonin GroES (HSP10)
MLTPVNDIVIVKHELREQTSGGIFLVRPDQKTTAKVLYVGRGVYNHRLKIYDNYDIEVGDIILFEKHRGHEVEYYGEKYLAIGMDTILGIYKKEDLIDGEIPDDIDVGDQSFLNTASTPMNFKPKSAFDGLI